MLEHFAVDYSVPEEEEIEWAMKRIHSKCSWVPSGMQEEHLRHWLKESREMETPYATNWMKVVDLVQTTFQDGQISEEATFRVVFLIPKGGS